MYQPVFNARNAICLSLLIAVMSGLGWGLHALSKAMSFSGFMVFGVITVALMIIGGFVWDRFERNRPPRLQ
jgi:lysylphosphatidylglycerol synthetase-like protein (DUF2156 family)